MWLISIPIIIIILFVVYNYVLLPKWSKNISNNNQLLMDEFAERIRGREDEVRQEYAKNNSFIAPITKQVQEDEIMAIVSCQEKREMKDFLRQQGLNIAGKAVGRLVGVGFKEVDNTEHYYLVLSPERLHYLHFSEQGKCIEHLIFKRKNMSEIESGEVSSKEMIKNNAAIGDTKRLSFISDDVLFKFFFYKIIWGHPLGKITGDEDKEFAEVNFLFAEPFKKFAQQYEH